MISPNDIIDALTRCTGYDSAHTPVPNEITVDAWIEHFDIFPAITPADLFQAVREYYMTHHDQMLQPVDISSIARKYSRERYERSDVATKDHPASDERLAHEALCDLKAEPERPAIEGARRAAIESYAQRFGISAAEAVVRMQRSQDARNELDATAIEVAHRRQSRPPAPLPCPDCGSTDVPCPCETKEAGDVG